MTASSPKTVRLDGIEIDASRLDNVYVEARKAFCAWAREGAPSIRASAAGLSGPDFDTAKETVYGFFHDMKGGGGSVGLELMSGIGESACAYIRELEEPSPAAPKIALAHVTAAEGVLAAEIHGDGGEAGAVLLAKLKAISA